jgi:hypothetical protein
MPKWTFAAQGLAHEREWEAVAEVDGTVFSRVGTSKVDAKRKVAVDMLAMLQSCTDSRCSSLAKELLVALDGGRWSSCSVADELREALRRALET